MSIVKLALEEHKSFVQRHPHIAAGIALTGGLAAADAGLSSFNRLRDIGVNYGVKPGLKEFAHSSESRKLVGKAALHGLGQGALYGSILSTVEPAIQNGLFRKKEQV